MHTSALYISLYISVYLRISLYLSIYLRISLYISVLVLRVTPRQRPLKRTWKVCLRPCSVSSVMDPMLCWMRLAGTKASWSTGHQNQSPLHVQIHTYRHTCVDTYIQTYVHRDIHSFSIAYAIQCMRACPAGRPACRHPHIRSIDRSSLFFFLRRLIPARPRVSYKASSRRNVGRLACVNAQHAHGRGRTYSFSKSSAVLSSSGLSHCVFCVFSL